MKGLTLVPLFTFVFSWSFFPYNVLASSDDCPWASDHRYHITITPLGSSIPTGWLSGRLFLLLCVRGLSRLFLSFLTFHYEVYYLNVVEEVSTKHRTPHDGSHHGVHASCCSYILNKIIIFHFSHHDRLRRAKLPSIPTGPRNITQGENRGKTGGGGQYIVGKSCGEKGLTEYVK